MNRTLSWFAENSVVANLLMALIVASGLLTIPTITREIFPEFSLDMISIQVPYLGAAPEEVEEGVCVRIEEAIQDLEDIKQITSTATEGMGTVTVELEPGADVREVLDDIKTRVDAIDTFPEETEKPIISEMTNRRQVIDVAIAGHVDEATLKALGERVRDELTAIDGITQVQLVSARPYEVSIEVSEETLRRYNLTFDAVARAVRTSSLDLPGGSIRTKGGEILLRTKGQAYRKDDFERIVLLTRPDGTRLLLGDVARVVDGFAETDQWARFSGMPAVDIRIFRVGDQNALEIARKVKEYVERAQERMPPGVTISTWHDSSRILQGRLDLMIRNARNGFILVFMILALFLKLRLAFWVSLGIPISFLGAFWLMPTLGATINLVSLFAFIVVLGIVVDDAIIVGENIYKHNQRGQTGPRAAALGASEVAVPVVFGVLTTVVAFLPLIFVTGTMGKVMKVIPVIVVATLSFSLLESLLILPAHLSHTPKRTIRNRAWQTWNRFQTAFAERFERLRSGPYRRLLDRAITYRYTTAAVAAASLVLMIGIVGAGWVKFFFFHTVESDYVTASLTMPPGTPAEATEEAIRKIEEAALDLKEELCREVDGPGPPSVRHIFTAIGDQPFSAFRGPMGQSQGTARSNVAEIALELAPAEVRKIDSAEIVRRWRELTPPIPDAVELKFSSTLFSPGEAINVQLSGLDLDELRAAADRLKAALADYAGVEDITDSFREGKREIKLHLKPAAEAYGITLLDLARQVRQAFYGEEAQRIQRGRDDVRVMVRYPKEERRSIGDLENMRIRTASGGEIPFLEVARAELGRGYSTIRRVDRRRTVNVTADVDPEEGTPGEILADLEKNVLPAILADYPGVSYAFEGEQREQAETMAGLMRSFVLALILIYALIAIAFKSYFQPVIVMSVIPFGFVGAVLGHILMGMDMTILSLFGLVALTGIVVNDSIVLVHHANKRRTEGHSIAEAAREAGLTRFRPVILTSVTTFAGLTPLLLERSIQAKFLIPMAISLGFGVIFATLITLFVVPAGYQILEDVKALALRAVRRPDQSEGHGARS